MEHARLSASGAKKWLNCPLSVTLEEQIPEESSIYAEEGTKAHELAESMVKKALNIEDIIEDIYVEPEDKEQAKYIEKYCDYVVERYNSYPNAIIEIEKRVDFSPWVPDGFGTSDTIILAGDTIEIIDLKYGKGVKVHAENNPQLMLYALGALNDYGFAVNPEKVIMSIVQPRLDHISSSEISIKELLDFGKEVKPKALKAHKGEGECVPGEHCNTGFCRAKPICRAYANSQLEIAKLEDKAPHTLSSEEIAEILDKVDLLSAWCKSVKEHALKEALKGTNYKGYKLVEGRSLRCYGVEEKEIIDVLKDNGYVDEEIYDKELKSISKLEKALGKSKVKQLIGEYIVKPPGKPTLVADTDERPAIGSALNDFKDI